MSSSRIIKKRIRSTKNISQITKAMEAVSAVKMRKSQEVALRSRPYALAALEVLKNVSGKINQDTFFSPLLEQREVKKAYVAVITSDKGLCGAFNGNVLRKAVAFIDEQSRQGKAVEIIAIGKKSVDFFKNREHDVLREVVSVGDLGAIDETAFLARFFREAYERKECDEMYAIYTNFLSVIKQEVVTEKILPFAVESISKRIDEIVPVRGMYAGTPKVFGESKTNFSEYAFEPSPSGVLDALLPMLLEIQVYHIVLEANASEHSARMVAMKNASENAGELIEALTLSFNKIRQTQITGELAEITAGAAALE